MPSHSGHSEPPGRPAAPNLVTVVITDTERDLLVKACRLYRRGLPIYLQTGETEARVVDALIRKLSERENIP